METLKDVTAWMKGTDLAEIAYRKDGTGFSLTAAGAEAALPALPSDRFTPVVSTGVGIFQWSAPGKPRKAEEGATAAEGDVLGVVITGSGAAKPILAPVSGRVSRLLVEAGQAVEYGQAILFLEKR